MRLRSHPSVVKAVDIASVRFSLPDLEKAEAFLKAFGFTTERTGRELRGLTVQGQTAYHAEEGSGKFLGLTFWIDSEAGLKALAESDGVRIDDDSLVLTDPDGWRVGVQVGSPSAPWGNGSPRNEGGRQARPRVRLSVSKGPARILRLGHVVLRCSDFEKSLAWYQDRFGLLVSDAITGMDGQTTAGAFLRCDRSDQLTDHHSLFLMQSPDGPAAFEHAAFEVGDIDSLMAGSDYLANAGYQQDWGIGRHVLGAHIFDYWRDPFGFVLEHWTDGDMLDASEPEGRHGLPVLLGTQWGPVHPLIRGDTS